MTLINWLVFGFVIYLLYKLFRWGQSKQKRYIPQITKKEVLQRYYGMCAVCSESNQMILEFHHRKEYSQGGDNSEKNIVPLCPYHNSLITRYPPNSGGKS